MLNLNQSVNSQMKKSTIWLLTVLMALTLTGLLYIQIVYMESMMKMRDDQFAEGVRRSLYAVSSLLEQDETKYFLEEDVAEVESSSVYTQYGGTPHLGGVKYSFTTHSGLVGDVTVKADADKIYKLQSDNSSIRDSYNSMRQELQGQYLYQKGIIDDVIINIMNKAADRTYLWNDRSCIDDSLSPWRPTSVTTPIGRLAHMAQAYATPASKFYKNDSLKKDVSFRLM